MKRCFGQIGKLKRDKIEEYCRLHAAVWPGVLKTISECNLQNYSIFLCDDLVFSYFEYVGEDFDADMEKMAQDPVTQEWWTHTHPCFERFAFDSNSEFYHDMKQIFYHP
ncbi:MAG: L-rhamnose mutarotase [Christensenellaceae bacterium]|nr:L-rhamnose mutarotase [Christensenellaceae bacterium]